MFKLAKTQIMKNFLLLLVSLFFITSCEMKEKIYINSDNSIKYALHVDMPRISQMMAMDPEAHKDGFPVDSILTMEQFLDGDFMGKSKKRDKEDLEKARKVFEDFKVHVKMNENEGFFSFFVQDRNVDDLNATLAKFRKNLNEKRGKSAETNEEENAMSEFIGNLTLNYDGKHFSRSSDIHLGSMTRNSDDESKLSELAAMMTYSLEYHFPKPIKSISDTTVLLSWDRKTVYIKKPITELMQNPKAYNFTLELED